MKIHNVVKSQYHRLVKAVNTNPYTFYRYHYVPDNYNILDLHITLRNIIAMYNPKSVFEFGYGTGKNLKLLNDMNPEIELHGCDISTDCQHISREILPKARLMCGSEHLLKEIKEDRYDLSFTCSVLNHIPDISIALAELMRITKNQLIICESNKKGKFFYPHDYKELGFEYIKSEKTNIAEYAIYIMKL